MVPSDEELIEMAQLCNQGDKKTWRALQEVRDRAYRVGQIETLKRCREVVGKLNADEIYQGQGAGQMLCRGVILRAVEEIARLEAEE